jgi:hypothetical protein
VATDYRPADRARDYRKRAHHCIVAAVAARDTGAREALLDIAFGWTRMAQQLEKMDPKLGPEAGDLDGVQVLIIAPKREH